MNIPVRTTSQEETSNYRVYRDGKLVRDAVAYDLTRRAVLVPMIDDCTGLPIEYNGERYYEEIIGRVIMIVPIVEYCNAA